MEAPNLNHWSLPEKSQRQVLKISPGYLSQCWAETSAMFMEPSGRAGPLLGYQLLHLVRQRSFRISSAIFIMLWMKQPFSTPKFKRKKKNLEVHNFQEKGLSDTWYNFNFVKNSSHCSYLSRFAADSWKHECWSCSGEKLDTRCSRQSSWDRGATRRLGSQLLGLPGFGGGMWGNLAPKAASWPSRALGRAFPGWGRVRVVKWAGLLL